MIINRINKDYKKYWLGYLSEENAKDEPNYFEAKSDCCLVLDPLYVAKDFIQEAGNYAVY